MLIAALLFSICTNLIMNSMAYNLIAHQTSQKNYQANWEIIYLLEEDVQRLLKSEQPIHSIDKLLQQNHMQNEPLTSIEHHMLSFQANTNYTLYIQIERIYNSKSQAHIAKIIAWHFGA